MLLPDVRETRTIGREERASAKMRDESVESRVTRYELRILCAPRREQQRARGELHRHFALVGRRAAHVGHGLDERAHGLRGLPGAGFIETAPGQFLQIENDGLPAHRADTG